MNEEPMTELDPRYSGPGAVAIPWSETVLALADAGLYWISTVRADGRPPVTPLVGVWHEASMYFTTGADERKAKNLEHNPDCVLTTGNNEWDSGFDVVLEGRAVRVQNSALLRRVADVYREKYGDAWSFEVLGASFVNRGMKSIVFELTPETVFGFGKGPFSQTRYRF
jgi:hypothetical protein